MSRRENGAEILVAVLDAAPSELDEERHRLRESTEVMVEVLDRDAFVTIRRLESAGVLRFVGDAARELYRSPRLDDGAAVDLEQARRLAGEADRKLRMASLLAGGGFESEAMAPAGDALKAAVRSLAMVSGDGDPGDSADVGELAGRFAGKGVLPLELRRGIEATQADDTALQPQLSLAGDLLAHVRDALKAAACQSTETDRRMIGIDGRERLECG